MRWQNSNLDNTKNVQVILNKTEIVWKVKIIFLNTEKD